MSGVYFGLRFDAGHVASARGSVWVTFKLSAIHKSVDISHDCGSIGELRSVVSQMHRDLEKILTNAEIEMGNDE